MSLRISNRLSKEQLQQYANDSRSIAQMCQHIGIKAVGANYQTVKRLLQTHDIKADHWTGQAWSKGEQLKDWSSRRSIHHMKLHLIRERGHCCESCYNTEWLGQSIPLELDHVDGDRTNNDKENQKLLCPNCHAFTPTYRGRKNGAAGGDRTHVVSM